MTSTDHPERRAMRQNALRRLQDEARRERAACGIDSPERHFYLGVETAAEEVLRPELAMARSDDWPAGEVPAFQEGYRRMTAALAAAGAEPLRLLLPDPPAGLAPRRGC